MLADGDKPKIGDTATTLGVRVPPNPKPDIPVDDRGMVRPNTEGMSVSPAISWLPPHRIPRRLRTTYPEAKGSNNLVCWRMGEGPFEAGPLAADLFLRLDPVRPTEHAFVEPDREMALTAYRNALSATQEQWVRDEGDDA